MHKVIDAALDLTPYATRLAAAGVETVIRYYNNKNGSAHPTKCLTDKELAALFDAGLSVAVVFEQLGGARGDIDDLSEANGTRDAKRALALAQKLGQPKGSAIYFAVDYDFYRPAELQQIRAYFAAVRAVIGDAYAIGVYGSGTVAKVLKAQGLVEHIWLAGASGWSGTREMLRGTDWTLFQKDLELASPIGGFDYDGNVVNPAHASFGQFSGSEVLETPRGLASAALYRVTARSGLNLRAGPGETYRATENLPLDTLLRAVGRSEAWIAVDRDGDGALDGYVHGNFLEAVSGGLPLPFAQPKTAYDVARAELALGVAEIRGDRDEPRIVMYHASTAGGAAPDETAWCSSFVNYCVEQAGGIGTNSKWARTWHESGWGRVVTDAPQVGDIVVWRRRGGGEDAGHVAFYVESDETQIKVLGGNQGNRVCEAWYPRHGRVGSYQYDLLSIRR